MKLRKETVRTDTLIRALATDYLALLVWSKTKDGQKNRGRPQSIAKALTETKKKPETRKFRSGRDFAACWKRLTGNAAGR